MGAHAIERPAKSASGEEEENKDDKNCQHQHHYERAHAPTSAFALKRKKGATTD
jgi:hypothetical protein